MNSQELGADVAQLRAAADSITASTGRVADVEKRLHQLIFQLEWYGPEAERFRAHYPVALRVAFEHFGTGLLEQAALLRANADQQDSASASNPALKLFYSMEAWTFGNEYRLISDFNKWVAQPLSVLGAEEFLRAEIQLTRDVQRIEGRHWTLSKAEKAYFKWVRDQKPTSVERTIQKLDHGPISKWPRAESLIVKNVKLVKGAGKALGVVGVAAGAVSTGIDLSQHHYVDATFDGVGTVGSALMMIPTPWTVGIGAVLVGASLIWTYRQSIGGAAEWTERTSTRAFGEAAAHARSFATKELRLL